MEPTRPIRALIRGLEALTVLNQHDGGSVSELAQEIRLPRTTVYRILETLCNAGFIERDVRDERYRLTALVRSLSDGFDDEAWVDVARPLLEELGRELVWPVSLATLSGSAMVVRAATDHLSPLAIERCSTGGRLALLTSAAGICHLAFCTEAQRDLLLGLLASSKREEDRLARARPDLERLLMGVRAQGHASTTRSSRRAEEISLCVPVPGREGMRACLTVRFAAATLSQRTGIERLLPRLKLGAAKIAAALEAQRAGEERRRTAPQTVS